jgi:orotate phosphoribosyltransferase
MNEEKVAQYLLESEAIYLRPEDPFTWSSGIKSPIYCDNRQLISEVEARNFLVNNFVKIIHDHYPQVDFIAGTSTAGIPWAAWIAEKLQKPMIYVRSSKKDHGRENLIEGKFKTGSSVIVIEDLISTGGSSMKVIEALQNEKALVLSLIAIFSYEFKAAAASFSDKKIPVHTLCDFSTLLKCATSLSKISSTQADQIFQWKNQY